MYNVKKYIDSGVLELFVLNALQPHEREAVARRMIHKHTALQDEIEKIKSALQYYKNCMEVPPSPAVKKTFSKKLLPKMQNNRMPLRSLHR